MVAMARKRPLTEWELRSPEERAAILNAPFPPIDRYAGKSWAGTIVVDETDDPLLRHYKSIAQSESGTMTGMSFGANSGTIDNVFRSMEE